jgi:hypothetical protein
MTGQATKSTNAGTQNAASALATRSPSSRVTGLPLVVACLSAVLVAPAPGGPVQPVPGVVRGSGDQVGEEAGDFVAGQGDLPVRAWVAVRSIAAATVR